MSRHKNKKNYQDQNEVYVRRLYTQFVDYIQQDVDLTDNPFVVVNPRYDDNSYKYLVVTLDQVESGTTRFFRDIEDFRDGTEVKSVPSSGGEGNVTKVKIPLYTDQYETSGNDKTEKTEKRRGWKGPSMSDFLVNVVMAMIVVTGAVLTTTREEWEIFFV